MQIPHIKSQVNNGLGKSRKSFYSPLAPTIHHIASNALYASRMPKMNHLPCAGCQKPVYGYTPLGVRMCQPCRRKAKPYGGAWRLGAPILALRQLDHHADLSVSMKTKDSRVANPVRICGCGAIRLHLSDWDGWMDTCDECQLAKRRVLNIRHAYERRSWNRPREPYARRDIFERDGWVCQLCDLPIDQGLKYPDPWSPSIDHVIPLSWEESSDTPANVQASHLGCNMRKGARATQSA